jgi:hypothetical protein
LPRKCIYLLQRRKKKFYDIDKWTKTLSFVLGKLLQPSLIFVRKGSHKMWSVSDEEKSFSKLVKLVGLFVLGNSFQPSVTLLSKGKAYMALAWIVD